MTGEGGICDEGIKHTLEAGRQTQGTRLQNQQRGELQTSPVHRSLKISEVGDGAGLFWTWRLTQGGTSYQKSGASDSALTRRCRAPSPFSICQETGGPGVGRGSGGEEDLWPGRCQATQWRPLVTDAGCGAERGDCSLCPTLS